jgi:hypothetical protein
VRATRVQRPQKSVQRPRKSVQRGGVVTLPALYVLRAWHARATRTGGRRLFHVTRGPRDRHQVVIAGAPPLPYTPKEQSRLGFTRGRRRLVDVYGEKVVERALRIHIREARREQQALRRESRSLKRQVRLAKAAYLKRSSDGL